ncbi:MAG: DUF1800 domain-containing protein [Gemmataceae bacterium]
MSLTSDPKRAWAPYKPTADNPWDLRKVGHFYRRAGFGATWTELQAGLDAGPEKLVDSFLAGGPDGPAFPDSIKKGNNGNQLSAWWLVRLRETKNPLREKMTVFWHNHFATSNNKVQNAGYMIGMYELFYKNALGNFRTLLHDVSKDPAMLIWLDTNQSTKGMPNENYARELMELFSLGIGNYTENDIREAARAFTGWDVRDGKAMFLRQRHDGTDKTVFGKTSDYKSEDIVTMCLEKECCPYFVASKLYHYLVSETVPLSKELLAPLAEEFRKSDYDFGAMVATVLRSNLFFAPEVYRTRVKAPVDFAMNIVRGLEGNVPASALTAAMEGLGQRLFYPPSVKGWDGGLTWLNATTLLFRQNLALALSSTTDPRFNSRTDPAALARKYNKATDEEVVSFFLDLFLQGDVPPAARARVIDYLHTARSRPAVGYDADDFAASHPVRTACYLVLSLPEFQLD